MSRAEDRALEAYPEDIEEFVDINGVKSVVDNNSWQRTIFLKGYHQAEKDKELSWKDMELIIKHYQDIMAEKSRVFVRAEDYQELLKRFNKERKEK